MEYNNDLLNQLELTINNAIEVERDYKNTIKILQEENDFLSDVIMLNNLGLSVEERKGLFDEVKLELKKSIKIRNQGLALKSQYENLLEKIKNESQILNDKQNNIDKYINKIVDDKVQIIKDEYNRELKNNITENNLSLQKHKRKLNIITLLFILILLIFVIIIKL